MKQIEHINILVVGDIMLDKYTVGEVLRISPEAPVPIVNVIKEYFTLGGCGNVVRNVREMGAQVDCLSSIGNDYQGEKIRDLLKEIEVGNYLIYESEKTTVKNRIIAGDTKTQLLRIDKEVAKRIEQDKIPEDKIKEKEYDIVIVSDYNKGMITKELIMFLHTLKGNPRIIVDPKPIHGYYYNDVYMITPNEKEWMTMKLSSAYNLKGVKYVLETKGSKGMVLYSADDCFKIASKPKAIYNVSGAGDTVIAAMGVCLSLGFSAIDAAAIANRCAGHVVTKPGTSTVPKEYFKKYLDESVFQQIK